MRPRGMNDQQIAYWLAVEATVREDGCWICESGEQDYPQTWSPSVCGPERVHVLMHRVVNVSDPTSEAKPYVLHTCDVKRCINPAHLRAGTPQQNVQDADKNGRITLKLSDDAVRDIRTSGESLSVYAVRYGVDSSYASLVRSRKRMSKVQD